MLFWREMANKIGHLLGRGRFEESLEEELRLHVEERADELAAGGMPRRDALAAARREFGPAARIAEDTRAAWRLAWLEDLAHDLRYALRALRRDPGFAAAAVVSLALGIGVNTTIFSLTAEFLFSDPTVQDPKTLVRVELGGQDRVLMPVYRFVSDAHVFPGLAGAIEMQEINWRAGETSQRLFATRVTDNYFEVTGAPVAIGRAIQRGERYVAVISQRFWNLQLHGDPNVLGRPMVLDGQPYTIVGVLPATHRTLVGFGYLPDVYVPVVNESTAVALYGRLPSGVTPALAAERLKTVAAELDRVYPDSSHKWSSELAVSSLLGIERLQERFLRTVSTFFAMLMGAVGLLLLIACANVASLLLARSSARTQEFAIRMSIGAGRWRVIRQMLAESLSLALLGTAAGLGLNYGLTRYLNRAVIAAPFPIQLAIEPDWRLLAYAALIAIGAAMVVGVLPALKSAAGGPGSLLKRDEHQVTGRRLTLRNLLVAGQLAVSVLVLTMAVLSVRNLMRTAGLDPGFDIRHTVWAQMRLVPENYPEAATVRAGVRVTLDRLRAVPGVASATVAAMVPLNDHFFSRSVIVYADQAENGKRVEHSWNAVGPDYFRTMGIGIVAGRDFSPADREGSRRVAILNEVFAAKVFGGESAVGRRIRFGFGERSDFIVVGVVRNSKYSTIGERNRPAMYEPYFQVGGRATVQLLVRAVGRPESLLKPLNAALLSYDPTAAVEIKPMSRALAFALMPSEIGAILLGAIGLLGLALAAVGLYGVMAYAISRRTREIGLRLALGAQRSDVVWLVLREVAWMVAGGLAVGGTLAALVTAPLARFLVPGLRPVDPVTYVVVAAVLVGVGAVASFRPALRAIRIDPMGALRHE